MKQFYFLIAFMLFLTACDNQQKGDRDVFVLGDDFGEISKHAETKKKVPDMDMLLRVKLPPNPTRSEVINYINVIYTLSRNQRSYLSSDPQIGMFTKVGRSNIDLLLQASKPGVPMTRYGIAAINQLAKEEDKEYLLSQLAGSINLSKVIYAKGWCKDAESIISEIVSSSSGYLPNEAIQCLAGLKNPEYYPALIQYMVDGWNSHTTYGIIKYLPNIDLSEALPAAWEVSRSNKYQIGYLTRDTLALGYMPAFHFLFDTVDDNYLVPATIYNAEALIKQFTKQTGNKKQLKSWYKKNRKKIQFDPKLAKYVVGKS